MSTTHMMTLKWMRTLLSMSNSIELWEMCCMISPESQDLTSKTTKLKKRPAFHKTKSFSILQWSQASRTSSLDLASKTMRMTWRIMGLECLITTIITHFYKNKIHSKISKKISILKIALETGWWSLKLTITITTHFSEQWKVISQAISACE